jgi:predicted tellurium resistance membrane protein TerC
MIEFLSSHPTYVVGIAVLVIWIGIVLYLRRLEMMIEKQEHE